MIESHPRLDWDEVFRCADSFLGGRMLRVGSGTRREICLELPLPADVASRVQKDGIAMEIAAANWTTAAAPRRDRRWVRRARFRLRRQMVPGGACGVALCAAFGDGAFRRKIGKWCACRRRSLRFISRCGRSGCFESMAGNTSRAVAAVDSVDGYATHSWSFLIPTGAEGN